MRLFKAMVILAAVLDLAMVLQSSSSPISASTPSQAISLTADNAYMPVAATRP